MYTDVLKLILSWQTRQPHQGLPQDLDVLFRELARDRPVRDADEIEAMVWALWTDHADTDASNRMDAAMEAMVEQRFDEAEELLESLTRDFPEWAEAWNKLATLHFIVGRIDESVAAIARTLALEPRHFGAICGFGQICLKQGDEATALAAFEEALRIHPHLEGMPDMVDELTERQGHTVH